ncbi:3253_t:CDS:1, partial [Dentiscutata heterogama]
VAIEVDLITETVIEEAIIIELANVLGKTKYFAKSESEIGMILISPIIQISENF